MLRVYSCIVNEHDLRLVVVAGLLCLLSAFTSISILERARLAPHRHLAWLALAGFVSGTGFWATHFVAMLAYEPNLPIGYDPWLTALSIAAAIVITGIGWRVALGKQNWLPLITGPIIASGVGLMHYIGMGAFRVSGYILYDNNIILMSIAVGVVLTTLALHDHRRRPGRVIWGPVLLLTLAICGVHFIGMGAASIIPDPRIAVPEATVGGDVLAGAIVLVAVVILAISFAIVLLDRKLTLRQAEEEQRLKAFANASIEGLVVCDGDRIVDANQSFLRLVGRGEGEASESLSEMFPDIDVGQLPTGDQDAATETRLIAAGGAACDVEVLARPLNWQGDERRILAVRDIRERKEAAERIAHLAYHDTLTGLSNRTVFNEHLARTIEAAAENGESVAVLSIDLDGFKAVNDVFGHPHGDELLVEAAHRLRAAVGDDELVARLGGDEFAIIQVGGSQPQRAGLLADRLVAALGEKFVLGVETARVSGSIGVALYPADANSAEELVKNADMALYRAKADGRGVTRFYESAMDEALRERRHLDAELRQAIDRGEVSIHYQPLAELDDGRIIAFEALLRWTHPVFGEVPPDQFVPLAEESGFIVRLGNWVLNRACEEAASWQPPLNVSVNLSPVQFMHGDLVAEIEAILQRTGLDPARLDLEITEGLLIKDADRALAILRRLKELGVQISMDDFGTGYSSLSYFRMFPFDKVKIDQSFVREMMENPQARAIVRSVIGLGHGLNMPVVAEGVETDEQLLALRAGGCNQVQGYLISRPGPIEQFERVVVDRADREEGGAAAKAV